MIKEMSIQIHIDRFDDANCRAGGEHQWYGDGVTHFQNGTSMNTRKFNLLSKRMQDEYEIKGAECTCNKCGLTFSEAVNFHL